MTLPRAQAFAGSPSGMTAGRPDRIWELRRALGRQLAALRSRAGFSQWEFAPLTGYSRSTLSDAELGRHRLRREFWLRCDAALAAGGVLVAAYDQIEATAAALRRKARSQAQAAREEQASERLAALLPVAGAAGAGPAGAGGGEAGVAGAGVAGAGPAAVEQCPHCRQPVAVVIVAAGPGDIPPS